MKGMIKLNEKQKIESGNRWGSGFMGKAKALAKNEDFERIKDEYRNGKSFKSAYEDGFKRSLSAIIDSNITTLIGGITLWALATGSVQGFAVTLVFSVVISLFSALFLTRMFANLLMPIANEEPSLFKLKRLEVE